MGRISWEKKEEEEEEARLVNFISRLGSNQPCRTEKRYPATRQNID